MSDYTSKFQKEHMLPILRAMLLYYPLTFIERLLYARNCCRSSLQKPTNLNRDSNKARPGLIKGASCQECAELGLKGVGVKKRMEVLEAVSQPERFLSVGVIKMVASITFETQKGKI